MDRIFMRKLILIILGLLFIPIIIVLIFVAIPLLIIFSIFLRMFVPRRRRTVPGRAPPPSGKVDRHDDVYDIECEVVDEEDSRK